jgi:Tfp pilus assembly protein PilO
MKRRWRQRDLALISLAVTLLGAGLWIQLSYAPGRARIDELTQSIARLDTELRRAEEARRTLPEWRERVVRLEGERRDFLAELPRANEVANVLDDIRTMADRAGVRVTDLGQTNAPEAIQGIRALGFNVAADGPFGAVMEFVAAFERTQRFMKVPQIGLSVDAEGSADPTLSVNVGFTVYVFVGADPGDPR